MSKERGNCLIEQLSSNLSMVWLIIILQTRCHLECHHFCIINIVSILLQGNYNILVARSGLIIFHDEQARQQKSIIKSLDDSNTPKVIQFVSMKQCNMIIILPMILSSSNFALILLSIHPIYPSAHLWGIHSYHVPPQCSCLASSHVRSNFEGWLSNYLLELSARLMGSVGK